MQLKYGLDDRPPFLEMVVYGLQWLAVAVPSIIVIGKVVVGLHFSDMPSQIAYLQRMLLLMALTLIAQVWWGHRLPLIVGPATVLLIGVAASAGRDLAAVYSAILIGGLILASAGVTGLFAGIRRFFSPQVVAVILLLIAFTLTPTIVNLILSPGQAASPAANLYFSLTFTLAMFTAHRLLPGFWRSTLIVWAMLIGSLVYTLLWPIPLPPGPAGGSLIDMFQGVHLRLQIDPGVLISFLICFLALSINDLGSIQSTGEITKTADLDRRLTRGITVTGLSNIAAGCLGVIGPVNYSTSPGVISATGCASRYTLLPAGAGLFILAGFPQLIGLVSAIPAVVVGCVLIYLMTSQIAAGLFLAFDTLDRARFENGLIIGLPLILGVMISFMPASALTALPAGLRPILGNGFVVGVVAALVLEHLIYRS